MLRKIVNLSQKSTFICAEIRQKRLCWLRCLLFKISTCWSFVILLFIRKKNQKQEQKFIYSTKYYYIWVGEISINKAPNFLFILKPFDRKKIIPINNQI